MVASPCQSKHEVRNASLDKPDMGPAPKERSERLGSQSVSADDRGLAPAPAPGAQRAARSVLDGLAAGEVHIEAAGKNETYRAAEVISGRHRAIQDRGVRCGSCRSDPTHSQATAGS